MTRPGEDRIARAALTVLADPAVPMLGSLLQVLPSGEVLAMISSGAIPARAADALDPGAAAGLRPALARLRARLARLNAVDMLARHAAAGIRLICPGDPDWPARLDDLGAARPYALWARGTADLQACLARPAAVVGARAATAYGMHVGGQIAAGLSQAGWTVVSGAAYGIDAAAHRAAFATDSPTVAVLACGPDIAFPAAHRSLLETIATSGAIVSEIPPGRPPARHQFLLRNRLIAALTVGTVIVEASPRSGTMNTARHAASLARLVMAVPGPVTSAASEGCHQLIRDRTAVCVTSAADVLGELHRLMGA